MRVESYARLSFMANPDRKIIIVRPIGELTARAFIDEMFQHFAGLDQPWTWNRLTDFRRFNGHISSADLAEIAERWHALTEGHDYHAHVAVVTFDAERLRIPEASPMFPNETICIFSDYHEAMGWLTAADRTHYLSTLGPLMATGPGDDAIRVD